MRQGCHRLAPVAVPGAYLTLRLKSCNDMHLLQFIQQSSKYRFWKGIQQPKQLEADLICTIVHTTGTWQTSFLPGARELRCSAYV